MASLIYRYLLLPSISYSCLNFPILGVSTGDMGEFLLRIDAV